LNPLELLQCRPQVLNDVARENIRFGQVLGVLQTVVLQPEDVEVRLVPLNELVVFVGLEPLGFLPIVAVLRIVAVEEVLQVLERHRIPLEGEVLVGPEVVDPERLRPRRLTGGLAVEEKHIGLHPLGVEDARRKAEESVHVVLVE